MINNAYFLIALDIELRKCFPNKTYYESRKNKEEEIDQTYYPLYFIQPNEIDARIVAYYFRKEIHL